MTPAGRVRLVLRLALTLPVCLILWLTALLSMPVVGWHSRLRYRWINHLMRLWGHSLARLWGMRIRVSGPRPRAPFFLVCNHISYTDILLLCAVCPAWFISKSEVASWPGIGPLTRMGHTIFIDRETRRDVRRMNAMIADRVRDGGAVGFFPEGTTSDGTDVLPFKPSLLQPAIDLDLPLTLAAIQYHTPPEMPPPSEHVAWIGDEAFAPHIKRLLAGTTFSAHIRFAEQTPCGENRKQLALDAREGVRTLLADMRRHSPPPPPPAS